MYEDIFIYLTSIIDKVKKVIYKAPMFVCARHYKRLRPKKSLSIPHYLNLLFPKKFSYTNFDVLGSMKLKKGDVQYCFKDGFFVRVDAPKKCMCGRKAKYVLEVAK